jgi:hypothetical protein
MAGHRDFLTGEDVENDGSNHFVFSSGSRKDIKNVARDPVVIPSGSRSYPPCLGDEPPWTEEEVKATATAYGIDPDEWVKLWKDESRFNETMLTRDERAARKEKAKADAPDAQPAAATGATNG